MVTVVIHNSARGIEKQTGVGLIEVLIALVIFALGVVGLAGLQLKTLSLTMDSSQRTYAMSKSQDIADRIRSAGIPVSEYDGTYTQAAGYCNNNVPAKMCSDGENDVVAAGCVTGAEMAAFDLYDVFCTGGGSIDGNSNADKQLIDWAVTIDCTPTVNCSQPNETVNIITTWTARSAIRSTDSNGDTVEQTDTMTLSFIP